MVLALAKSCLSNLAKSSDFSLRIAEKAKFIKDRRFNRPMASSATVRLIPLAVNHLCLRGTHFQAILKEFATIVVTNPAGCLLLQGPFALTHRGVLQKIMPRWETLLTWTLQREHVGQIVRGMDSFLACARFLSRWDFVSTNEEVSGSAMG